MTTHPADMNEALGMAHTLCLRLIEEAETKRKDPIGGQAWRRTLAAIDAAEKSSRVERTKQRWGPADQPFHAGDVVEVLIGPNKGEHWVVAVYEWEKDIAYIAGWPCSVIVKASVALKLAKLADTFEHQQMIENVARMHSDGSGCDPRKSALKRVQEAGGVP